MWKRELLFWLIVAAAACAYFAAGKWFAPSVPPEPSLKTDAPNTFEDFVDYSKKLKERNAVLVDRREFERRWQQWGAGVGIVLLLAYTWWRPPWREPRKPPVKQQKSRPVKSVSRSVWDTLPVSPSALLFLAATLVLLIVLVLVLSSLKP